MEAGKEQQAQARRKLAALYQPHLGQSSRLAYERAAAHYCTNGGPPWTCATGDAGEHGGGAPVSSPRHIRPLCSTSEQQ